ncbi:hypothetical protein NC653_010385 [Populus alba x Populus x berolinensis]|uniref:Uncharacterized protein n=1 Tax=Populus alba x Populus x berolinensis TaxID=444605 RepID=A0AAD6W545_9ROSI|nr:hypothetical protein NC653_010385 [Populus alba x Populus x berolinensis]
MQHYEGAFEPGKGKNQGKEIEKFILATGNRFSKVNKPLEIQSKQELMVHLMEQAMP